MPARRLAARWVIPVEGCPIERGAVLIGAEGRVMAVGPDAMVPRPAEAVAETYEHGLLLPGLINTHTHLELTGLSGEAPEPDFAAWIRGVIGLRGKIIPIFDLAARMGLEPTGSEPGKIVIVSSGAGQVGVMVDDVEEVLTVEPSQLEDVPTANRDSIEAIAKIDDRLVVLLNADGLFAREAELVAAA